MTAATKPAPPRARPRSPSSPRRRWLFRLLAVMLGLSPFVAAEIGLRLAGAGIPSSAGDPFVTFASERPLFELNAAGDRYQIPSSRQPFFKPDGFAARKGPREFRIFCLGGSTVQGNPYSIETSFTTWLELSLQAADPNREWQVVNCGGISYASYRLAPILGECLRHQPDLIIVYMGHNEFLEERSYASRRKLPVWLAQGLSWLHHSRLFALAQQSWQRWLAGKSSDGNARTELAAEVDALLDYRGGLEQYQRDDAWRQGVVDHFHGTLARMVQETRQAGVPMLLVDPVCNLKDCPPFKTQIDTRLSPAQRERLEALLQRAGRADQSAEVIESCLDEVLRIDARHAGAWYLLGQTRMARGDAAAALDAFVRAKEEDLCPLRIIEPIRDAIDGIGRSTGVPVVPVKGLFEQRSPHGIPGEEWLLDHVHPSITGHQLIADLLQQTMVRQGLVAPTSGWELRRQQRYSSHLATLDTPYFARGQEHLEGLRKWAHGRVTRLRAASPSGSRQGTGPGAP